MASGPAEKRARKHRGSHDGHARDPASVAVGAAEPENRLHGSADAAVVAVVAVVAAAVTTSTVSTAAIHAAVVSARDAAPDQADGRLGYECPVYVCAVRRRRFPVGASPTRRTLQPEATGAVMEVTKWLKPSV
jgi:hypothetical protein